MNKKYKIHSYNTLITYKVKNLRLTACGILYSAKDHYNECPTCYFQGTRNTEDFGGLQEKIQIINMHDFEKRPILLLRMVP